MLLKNWLIKEGIRPYVFARTIGMAAPNMYRCLNGTQRLSAKYALVIEAITGAQVTRTELLFPEDFEEVDENGNIQLRSQPRIHVELAKNIELKRKEAERPFNEEDFFTWAYGIDQAQSPVAHCVRWADTHPDLNRVDLLTIEEGIDYMKSEYQKYLRKKDKVKKKQ